MTIGHSPFSSITSQNSNERIAKSSHRLSKILYRLKLWLMRLEKRSNKLNSQEETQLNKRKVLKSMLVVELRRKF